MSKKTTPQLTSMLAQPAIMRGAEKTTIIARPTTGRLLRRGWIVGA
jgi:hypothetical protein